MIPTVRCPFSARLTTAGANFGQGAPETGPLPGAMPRPTSVDLSAGGDEINEYAPTAGVKELRQAVADYYNREYRQGKDSQYTFRNVCIVPGGRAGIAVRGCRLSQR